MRVDARATACCGWRCSTPGRASTPRAAPTPAPTAAGGCTSSTRLRRAGRWTATDARACRFERCLAKLTFARYRDRSPMRHRRRPPLILAVLIPLALVLGIWLGGHPDSLPGFARDDARRRHRRAPLRGGGRHDRARLLPQGRSRPAARTSRWRPRSSRWTTSSRTTSRRRTTRSFQLDTEGQFEGVGMTVTRGQGGPARRGGLRRLAGARTAA